MITQSELKEILDYDPETGIFRWKISPTNCVRKGSVAGNKTRNELNIKIKGKQYSARRLAWVYVHGVDPGSCVVSPLDHDNYNNKICNLRIITRSELGLESQKNMKPHSTNKSGITGVSWNNGKGRWVAKIYISGKYKHLGYFENLISAKKARQEANVKYGFSETHGEERCPF